jgi:ABC-2 type transport system permease protein
VTVVRYRSAWALGNAVELPVWLVSGFLVPISILPDWVRPISWVLAPTWGVRAIREAALGGHPLPDLLLCLLLGTVYLLVGVFAAESILRSARRNASLSLS